MATLLFAGAVLAQPMTDQASAHNLSEMKFGPITALPTCVQASIQSGDPEQGAFIALMKVKAGCTVPWHWHTGTEQVTIVEGKARVQMKDTGKPVTLRAGGFAMMPSRHIHEFRCLQDCTLVLHSDQKFDMHYVDPQGNEISPEDALKLVSETAAPATK